MLTVSGLCTEYLGEHGQTIRAAQDVSFDVPQGRLFTLLGPSGCGKTTTLRSIAGLERPKAGEITVNDRVVYSSSKGVFIAPNRRGLDRKSTRLNSSHLVISYAVFCLNKKI